MSHIATSRSVIKLNIIDRWECSIDDIVLPKKLTAKGFSGSHLVIQEGISLEHVISGKPLDRHSWESITSLSAESIYYLTEQWEKTDEYYHFWEIGSLILDILKHLEKKEFKSPNGLDVTLHKIATSPHHSRIVMPYMGQRITRVEAIMLLKGTECLGPIDFSSIDSYGKATTLTFVPENEDKD